MTSCIVAIGSSVAPSMEAADMIAKEGFSVAVVNARFVKPIDEELIASQAKRCGLVVTVEENILVGGFGTAVLETLEQNDLSEVDVLRLGVDDVFVEHASQKEARSQIGLDADGIARSALDFLKKKGRSPKEKAIDYSGDDRQKAVRSAGS